MIAASYARYSSDKQDSSSIDQQQRKCREGAEARGHRIRPEFEFSDEAMSGTRIDRKGLQQMLAAAKDGQFQILYFESLSRLARELVISLPTLKNLIHNYHVRVISTSESLDSDQEGWEMLATFRSLMHAEFLKVLRATVMRGLEEARLNDYSVGEWCFGYRSEPVPGTIRKRGSQETKPRMRILIRDDHAKWVVQIFHWFLVDRWSISRIARELTKLKAPKDHRSTTEEWRGELVVKVLRNRKYICLWPWGIKTNVMDPLTGQVRQEERPPEEAAKYERERPPLRIIDDEPFFRVQALLDYNAEVLHSRRDDRGRIWGSTRDAQNPRHMLQGIVKCAKCGSTMKVAGSQKPYLKCSGYLSGKCEVKTQLRRDYMEASLLEAISKAILGDAVWLDAVVRECQRAWKEERTTLPDRKKQLDLKAADLDAKITCLVDAMERTRNDDGVAERLEARRVEQEAVRRELRALGAEPTVPSTLPTLDWVNSELQDLFDLLKASGSASAVALRGLVGEIRVAELQSPTGKRKYFRAEFRFQFESVFRTLGYSNAKSNAELERPVMAIDVLETPEWAKVADRVKELFDAGMQFTDMCKLLKCPRAWPKRALKYWNEIHDVAPIDGRKCRQRCGKSPLSVEKAERAKVLFDAQYLLQDIARELGCSRNTVTNWIAFWHTSRGLPVPDGKERRKSLPRKSERPKPEEEEGQASDPQT
jgi:DNA invertase Pin-like site-specific DNA recombinase